MTEIPEIYIPEIVIPQFPVKTYLDIEVPGCTYQHRDQNLNRNLLIDDPNGVFTACDGQIPSFYPMDWNPNKIRLIEEKPPSSNEPSPVPESKPSSTATNEDCPPADAPEIGSKVPDGKGQKEITGYQLIGNKCVTQYEKVELVEQIFDAIPSAPQVVTTGSIAIIATASAAATPFLLRVVKPLVKQVINRIKKILGRKTEELSVAQRREKQRELTAAIRTLKKMKK